MIFRQLRQAVVEAAFAEAGPADGGPATRGRSLAQDARLRLQRNKAAVVSIFLLTLLIIIAFVGPLLLPFNYEDPDWPAFRAPPSADSGHFFGTDQNGCDLLARTLYGTRVSLAVALVATLVSVIIGVVYGAVAGYVGGRTDGAMMRFVDIMFALPYILFVILLMVIFGRQCLPALCRHRRP